MGTRADFYIGRGELAEWLGSIGWDGYPGGAPKSVTDLMRGVDDVELYRCAVADLLADEQATSPSDGWPWPWDDSGTTDYAYAFAAGVVWASSFGSRWWPAAEREPDWDAQPGRKIEKVAVFPNMRSHRNVAPLGSMRSGTMAVAPRSGGGR